MHEPSEDPGSVRADQQRGVGGQGAATAGEPPGTLVTTADLAVAPETAAMSRRWVAATLRRWGWQEREDDVVLAVSELVTNALVHAGARVQVTMSLHGDDLWVAVHDEGVGRVVRKKVDGVATSGRGLQIVESLSQSWGVLSEGDGKSVWFELHDRI